MTTYAQLPKHLRDALDATKNTRLGAMLACAFMGKDQPTAGRPYFSGHASVTSDGFIMWNFVTKTREFHYGALAGDWQSLMDNLRGLVVHLGWARQYHDQQKPVSEQARVYMVDLQDRINSVLHYTYDHRVNFEKELKAYVKTKREAIREAGVEEDDTI
jgi:hypothetical protein